MRTTYDTSGRAVNDWRVFEECWRLYEEGEEIVQESAGIPLKPLADALGYGTTAIRDACKRLVEEGVFVDLTYNDLTKYNSSVGTSFAPTHLVDHRGSTPAKAGVALR